MSRSLLLLRHAKSSWADHTVSDRARPLNPRGERAAALMGVYLGQRGAPPSLVLCSTAQRARQTQERISGLMTVEPVVRHLEELYLATPDEILGLLRELPDPTRRVLVIGHNPGLEELAFELVGEVADGRGSAFEGLKRGLPTAGLVELDLGETGWRELSPASCRLIDFGAPKDLV